MATDRAWGECEKVGREEVQRHLKQYREEVTAERYDCPGLKADRKSIIEAIEVVERMLEALDG